MNAGEDNVAQSKLGRILSAKGSALCERVEHALAPNARKGERGVGRGEGHVRGETALSALPTLSSRRRCRAGHGSRCGKHGALKTGKASHVSRALSNGALCARCPPQYAARTGLHGTDNAIAQADGRSPLNREKRAGPRLESATRVWLVLGARTAVVLTGSPHVHSRMSLKIATSLLAR